MCSSSKSNRLAVRAGFCRANITNEGIFALKRFLSHICTFHAETHSTTTENFNSCLQSIFNLLHMKRCCANSHFVQQWNWIIVGRNELGFVYTPSLREAQKKANYPGLSIHRGWQSVWLCAAYMSTGFAFFAYFFLSFICAGVWENFRKIKILHGN